MLTILIINIVQLEYNVIHFYNNSKSKQPLKGQLVPDVKLLQQCKINKNKHLIRTHLSRCFCME